MMAEGTQEIMEKRITHLRNMCTWIIRTIERTNE